MSEPALAIFDDGGGCWGPLTDRRAVFDLRTGAATTLARLERLLRRADALFVPALLEAVSAERHPARRVNPRAMDGPVLLVNGRWAGLDVPVAQRIAALAPGTALAQSNGEPIAAHLPGEAASQFIAAGYRISEGTRTHALDDDVLYSRPWHVLDGLEAALRSDLDASEPPSWHEHGQADETVIVLGEYPVRVAADATVRPMVVFNNERGPIVIDHGARIESFVSLEGPCYIGAGTRVAPQTAIRAGTSIGPRCNVGGEIKHSIIQADTNKAHLGYLGDSLVGQWVNLGADTNVSNLKNTYGPVRVQLEPEAHGEDTGRTNHGPIIGDFVRTAIGTRLLTGSVVGTGSMLALSGLAPKHTCAFSFCTDMGITVHQFDALLNTVRRMTARCDVALSDNEAALLRSLHARATAAVA